MKTNYLPNNNIIYSNNIIKHDSSNNNIFINSNSLENNLLNNYCNNCGKNGHMYHQCRQPITSIGIIAFRNNKMNNKIEFLLIRRNHSLGFSDFISGKYPLYNKNYLINIINEMSNSEKKMILEKDFDDLWKCFWGETENVKYRSDEKISRSKYISLKIGITINNQEYNLKSLINESVTNWEETEWGFPKGRRNFQEKDLHCGIREFEEETGYNINELSIIQNLIPYEEIFTGSNYKSYKHKYYVGYMNNDNTNEMIKHRKNYEVDKIAWFNYENACSIIRPYNLEKLSILEKVNKFLTQYRLYS
jgi:ADP-ribose pyrophosphatase YjhB (NUDIX family)